jgi:negative regulator of sigma E activity
MNEASRLLDGDLTDTELTALLERLKHDVALRDEVSAQQLIRDGLAGFRSLDAGYTLRILAEVRRVQQRRS